MKTASLLDRKSLADKPEELSRLCEKLFSGGKSLRSRLICMICDRLDVGQRDRLLLCRIVEYIHNSSLLHDDFIDHSPARRRQKAAWVEFSPERAVLAGDYLLAQVGIYLAEEGNLPLLRLTAQSIALLVKGEFLQREFIRKKSMNLTDTDQVGDLKTAGLFKWSLKAPFLWLKREDAKLYSLLDRIGYKCGILFQRSDDLLDFSIRNKERKNILLDLKQNYFNSFSCFLVSGKDENFKKKFQNAGTLADIHGMIPDFENRVEAFDRENEKLIRSAVTDIEKLEGFLNPEERVLARDLQAVPSLLYWRDSSPPSRL